MPAVPTKSYGRVPAGLHDLLYGEKDAEFTIQMDEFPVKTAKYAVYLGESLRINSEALIDIPANAAQIDQLLAEGGSFGREIFDKMNTAQGEVFNFVDYAPIGGGSVSGLQGAKEEFRLRKRIIEIMNANNTNPQSDAPVWYSDPYPRAGATAYASPGGWAIGPYWEPVSTYVNLPNDPPDWRFNQGDGTSAYTSISNATQLRAECLTARVYCVLKAAAEVIGQARYDALHPDGTLMLYAVSHQSGQPLAPYEKHVTTTCDLKVYIPGDHTYMKNYDYEDWADPLDPTNVWTGENCVYVGTNLFSGLGLFNMTESYMRYTLQVNYDEDCAPHTITDPLNQIKFIQHHRYKTGN